MKILRDYLVILLIYAYAMFHSAGLFKIYGYVGIIVGFLTVGIGSCIILIFFEIYDLNLKQWRKQNESNTK